MRYRIAVAGLVVLVSCTPETAPTASVETAEPPRQTTTVPLPTTTELGPRPTRLTGAGTSWRDAVANVYGKACAGDRGLVPAEIAVWPEAATCPDLGRANAAEIVGTTVAVAVIGDDVVYGFDQGSGFSIVAARVPSLGGVYYGPIPKTVAVIGSDARPGEDVASARADSIHILGLNGSGGGAVLGIPRDSWVDYADGRRGKINGSLSSGGPDILLQTLANLTGLNFDGYVITGFEGFQELWGNVLGGVNLDLPSPMVDRASGADFAAGAHYFNGPEALAFARARKTLSGGDLTRTLNGGTLLLEALDGSRVAGPLAFPHLLQGGWPWMVTDLTAGELLAIGAVLHDTPTEAIQNVVAPGTIGSAGAASVVYLSSSARALFSDLVDGSLGS